MNLDTQNLPPEVAAYIRSLEQEKQRLEQRKQQLEQEKQLLEKQLVKMQSLMNSWFRCANGCLGNPVSRFSMWTLNSWTSSMKWKPAAMHPPEPGKTTPVKAHARKAKRPKKN